MSDKNRIWDDREYFAILGIDEDRALEITSKDIRSVYNTAIEGKDKGVNKHDREGFVSIKFMFPVDGILARLT